MMWRTRFRKFLTTMAAVVIAAGFAAGDAAAGWVFIADVDSTDSATNPGYPGNQNAGTVGAYLQDLLNLANAPTYKSKVDSYLGGALSGLGEPVAPDAFLLAFHFGNGNNYWQHSAQFDVFFGCSADCDTFTLPDIGSVSNYRLYSASVEFPSDPCCVEILEVSDVPEPESIALLGIGLAGLAFSRRRR